MVGLVPIRYTCGVAERRDLPSITSLSQHPELGQWPETIRIEASRRAVKLARDSWEPGAELAENAILKEAVRCAGALSGQSMKAAINMSGVILHTGLGRARLPAAVVNRVQEMIAGHCDLEIDLELGTRGDRQDHVRDLLTFLTGAEDALVVNNAAAALVLVLRALAFEKDVLLSRGQMVEIGGSFRVPEIVKQSGCNLVEVGTTNRTHLQDYQAELSDRTGAILVCHRSNFDIIGFTAEPTVSDLSALGCPVVDDMGTGCLVDLTQFGLPKAKTMADSIQAGADLSIGSGDKLLGGPQAGLIVGKAGLIEKVKRHPLARAMRVDKMTLAALEATLGLYAEGKLLEIPTLRYLARTVDEVKQQAMHLASQLGSGAIVEASTSELGGGSGVGFAIPSYRVGLPGANAEKLAHALRTGTPAIIGRVEKDQVWLDLRCVEDAELPEVARRTIECLS